LPGETKKVPREPVKIEEVKPVQKIEPFLEKTESQPENKKKMMIEEVATTEEKEEQKPKSTKEEDEEEEVPYTDMDELD